MRAAVETYGCTMNQGEGLELERALSRLGYELVPTCEEADLAVINTCVVIRSTELKMMKRLRQLRDLGKSLVVTGCMASVMEAEVKARFPGALVIAPLEYGDFPEKLRAMFGTGRGPSPPRSQPGVTAIVPIAQGCLGSCAYCITRLARGSLASISPEIIVSRARAAVEGGSKEVLLTAQDTGCYGQDIGTDLARLLSLVAEVPGDFRVRVGMMNPDSLRAVMGPLVDAYRSPKAYKFLHLPVQSGSDALLQRMGRRYSAKDFEGQVASFRAEHPDLTLSTDLIVGFPGETEEDHRASLSLVGRVRPNIVNVTRFSARPGTEAAAMTGQVVSRVAKERSRELTSLRFQVALELNRSRRGEELEAMVTEAGKPGTMVCRDHRYTPIVVPGPQALGSRLILRIVDAAPTHLMARVVG